MNIPRAALIFLSTVYLSLSFYYYPQLPETMASHFSFSGEANAWNSKLNFFLTFSFIWLFALFLPLLIKILPLGLLNLPNKEYWLTAERKTQALSILQKRFEWFSLGTTVLLVTLFYLTARANLRQEPLSQVSWFLIGGFLLFVLFWAIGFYRVFRLPENHKKAKETSL